VRIPLAGLPVQYHNPEELAAIFRRAGVRSDDMVVVYGDADSILGATMTTYCLNRIGHQNTAVLDGGIEAYRSQFPLTQAYPEITMGDVSPSFDPGVRATFEDVRKAMRGKGTFILDTRPAADYLGNTTRWMRNGHIPGAVNLDWHYLMQRDNPHAFRPVDEMRTLIEATGVRKNDDVIVYCGTSREATLVFHVMGDLLGYPNVRLYEGSWTEYCSKTHMAVERTPQRIVTAANVAHAAPKTTELEPYECCSVQRMHTINGVFLASQPAVEDFEQAKMGGIRTVINLRQPSETSNLDERAIVTGLGMNYYNPAWNGPAELTDHILDRSRELLRDAERPVLLHCSSANRAGAAWFAYRALDEGLDMSDALEEAKTVGLKSPEYERIVRKYIQRRRSR